MIRELLASLVRDDALVFHVALVAHQNDLSVIPRVRLNLSAPARRKIINETDSQQYLKKIDVPILNAVEGFLVRNIVHQKEPHSAAVISRGDGAIPLLPRRILK